MKSSFLTAWFLLVLFIPVSGSAAETPAVLLNEIAWMGTILASQDEWIELYNVSETPVNLDGWVLKSNDEKILINLSGTILAKNFYLLERTDDNTLPELKADKIYKGALANEGEHLKLYDGLGNLIDQVNCSSGWFFGDNKTKQTMERKNSSSANSQENWQNSQNPGGTPRAENSSLPLQNQQLSETGTGSLSLLPEKDQPSEARLLPPVGKIEENNKETNTANIITAYPGNIVFSEILASPEGADDKEEWIEIFNQNDFDVELSGWQIKDEKGGVKIYTFPKNKKIKAKSYLVLPRPETKITLNNSGDALYLLQPDEKIIDSITFDKAPRSESYNLTESGWQWSVSLTPGKANIIYAPPAKAAEDFFHRAIKIEPESGDGPLAASASKTAAVGEKIIQPPKQNGSGVSRPSFPTSAAAIALSLAIASAIAMLILKKKLQLP